ncbi:flagellar protein FlaG [Ammoniphilus sp. CFH 90114]|uniref:flagellar protein FlaG n=1 Tax=Ammoniphilus sp. CFH 90114 TaxID=2493665 RepID=UPI00100DABB4|nr:flagellar protein FlaG [Ammoniphilus sp. CFH 90114]RXT04456.1 hypothetical protein EIZ39_19725 [Ammoniphilus sp. CFH 90114]
MMSIGPIVSNSSHFRSLPETGTRIVSSSDNPPASDAVASGKKEEMGGNALPQKQKEAKLEDEKEREQTQQSINKILDGLNTGLALKFHEKSGEWYAVLENKVTREVVKEVPPKHVLDLEAKLKDMIGVFLDKKV